MQAQVIAVDSVGQTDDMRSNDGVRSLKILAGDPQFPHHGIQSRAWHAQTSGRFADHLARLPQHPDDVFPLHLLERIAAGGFRCICPYFGGARRLGPLERITARSMKFSSSRTFPGHDQLASARIVSAGILSICLFIFPAYFLVKCRTSIGMSSG